MVLDRTITWQLLHLPFLSTESFWRRNVYRSLLIALPEFEHCLRRVFIAVNEFAEERLLTAGDFLILRNSFRYDQTSNIVHAYRSCCLLHNSWNYDGSKAWSWSICWRWKLYHVCAPPRRKLSFSNKEKINIWFMRSVEMSMPLRTNFLLSWEMLLCTFFAIWTIGQLDLGLGLRFSLKYLVLCWAGSNLLIAKVSHGLIDRKKLHSALLAHIIRWSFYFYIYKKTWKRWHSNMRKINPGLTHGCFYCSLCSLWPVSCSPRFAYQFA